MEENKMIVLSEDDKAVCLKTLQDTMFAVKQLYGWIEKDSLTEGMKETLPNLVEFHMADISKILGFDSLSAEKVEKKHKQIREANEKIRELEKKLGSANPIDGLKDQLTLLAKTFKDWWRSDGFGYVVESNFTEYGRFEATLGFSFSRSSVFSKKPISDRKSKEEWLKGLKETGYHIFESDRGGDRELIDCPENRELLSQLLKNRFPSVLIERFETQLILESKELFEIHHMKIDIEDLADLKQLKNEMEQEQEEA